jgi:Plasmid pRiA4b ORF-3-like protein
VPINQCVFHLRVELVGIAPTIWRRLLVPGNIRLSKRHDIFQVAMGWTDSHLHCFTIGDLVYSNQDDDDDPEDELDENEVMVREALSDHQDFTYEYDFGDSWIHDIVVERMTTKRSGLKHAVCLDGERACPPEDCGGPSGYALVLEAIADPDHEEHEDFVTWLGRPFDPEYFDVAVANADLQRVK